MGEGIYNVLIPFDASVATHFRLELGDVVLNEFDYSPAKLP
jgi:hypothetical protein